MPNTTFPGGSERPLYEIKANLFKALAHPARIRVLEILSAGEQPTAVSAILAATELNPRPCLSILRSSNGMASSGRGGPATPCSTSSPTDRSPICW